MPCASRGGFNVVGITSELEGVARNHQLAVPPYFALVLRAFATIEGVALKVGVRSWAHRHAVTSTGKGWHSWHALVIANVISIRVVSPLTSNHQPAAMSVLQRGLTFTAPHASYKICAACLDCRLTPTTLSCVSACHTCRAVC
jgi:hypothetical protein